MWLSRLDLLAFGRFSDVRLTLGPGFHLVYGPNEAGKSTALRAIRQLLFGFDERTSDNFVHPNSNLRIGGAVCSHTNAPLEVIRRKTRKDSLRAADDTTIVDANRLQQLLCGIDEDTFSRRYGINHEQLVEGGREIAAGSGDLGEILFATGSGVMDLTAIQQRLNDEAAELFLPKGKKQRLNLALVEWQEQRENLVAKLLPASAWEEADKNHQELQVRLGEITSELSARTAERDRFRSWQQALPLVRDQDSLELQMVSFTSMHRLPADFGTKRQESLVLIKHATAQQQSATEAFDQARLELEKLAIPEAFLERADELTSLVAHWGSYNKAQLDRPGLIEQCNRHVETARELLQALSRSCGIGFQPAIPAGKPAILTGQKDGRLEAYPTSEVAPVPELILDRTLRSRIGQLGRQHVGLVQTLQHVKMRRDRISQRIQEIRAELAAMPMARSLEELREAVRVARSDGDLESQLANIRIEIAALQDEALRLNERLGLWTGSIADLKLIHIPTPEIIERIQSEFDGNEGEQSPLRARLVELASEHRRLDQQIEELQHKFQVPTEADLNVARTSRDLNWSEIRTHVSAKTVPPDSLIDSFEQSVIETDKLADRLRNEADRVAVLAEQFADRIANESRQHEISVRIAELEADRLTTEAQWKAAWPDLQATPLAPRDMQTWLARRETLLQNDAQFRRRIDESHKLIEQINKHVSSLSKWMLIDASITESLDEVSRPKAIAGTALQSRQAMSRKQLSFGWEQDSGHVDDGINHSSNRRPTAAPSLCEVLVQAEEQIQREDSLQRARRDADETLARLTTEQSETIDHLKRATHDLTEWQTVWQAAMSELNLAPDSSPEAAETHVETLFELAGVQQQIEQLRERIAGIDADALRFTTHVKSICQEIALDLVNHATNDAVKELRTRLSACQRDQTKFNDLSVRKDHAEKQLALALQSRTQGKSIVDELCRAAGLNHRDADETTESSLSQTLQELATVEEQARKRVQLEEKLARLRERLRELAAGQSIPDFTDQVRQQSPEAIATSLKDLECQTTQLAAERDRLNQQLGGVKLRLQQMDGSADAAEAEEKQRQWLARIRSDSEHYVRVKLASSVLHTAIERFREKTREPVLTTASELFRELTMDSFEGLRVDEDDHNKPILLGLRSGSHEPVSVSGMSEGTCDQLYLALRLASLQLESAPRSYLPFIVDDILVQFDDARAAAALRVLARLGQQRQVIFFTHHEHMLEIASKHIAGSYSEHRLDI